MKLLPKLLSAVGAAALLAFSSAASATTVPFSITNAQFLTGLGYGIDRDETPNGQLLDVRFSTSLFSTQNFSLGLLQSHTFNVGTIDFEEPIQGGGIDPTETDGLQVTAKLTFATPIGVIQTITTTGEAFVGQVNDPQVDYQIDWSPVEVLFGNGGKFRITLSDMSFSDRGEQNQTATITLLSFSEDGLPANSVPEPASIALLGIGIGCVAVARRRRAKA